jgi:hypothetical protein
MKKKKIILLLVIACATIGLAPHSEPHIWKQVKNIQYGRQMTGLDWLDVLIHGAPWLALAFVLLWVFIGRARRNKQIE